MYITATWRFCAYVFKSGTSHDKRVNIFQIPYYLPMYVDRQKMKFKKVRKCKCN